MQPGSLLRQDRTLQHRTQPKAQPGAGQQDPGTGATGAFRGLEAAQGHLPPCSAVPPSPRTPFTTPGPALPVQQTCASGCSSAAAPSPLHPMAWPRCSPSGLDAGLQAASHPMLPWGGCQGLHQGAVARGRLAPDAPRLSYLCAGSPTQACPPGLLVGLHPGCPRRDRARLRALPLLPLQRRQMGLVSASRASWGTRPGPGMCRRQLPPAQASPAPLHPGAGGCVQGSPQRGSVPGSAAAAAMMPSPREGEVTSLIKRRTMGLFQAALRPAGVSGPEPPESLTTGQRSPHTWHGRPAALPPRSARGLGTARRWQCGAGSCDRQEAAGAARRGPGQVPGEVAAAKCGTYL